MWIITFFDGQIINQNECEWVALPNKPIRCLEYIIGKNHIRLVGYEKYLHLKEIVQGVNISFKKISKVILVGKNGENCDKLTINLIKATIARETVKLNTIYQGKEIADNFWKTGQEFAMPNIYINHD